MSTIYEDIQALRERFKSEYGLEVDIHVSAHSTCNGKLKGYPAKQVVDLACKAGMPVEPYEDEYPRPDGRMHRWFKFWDRDNQIEIVLHR